MRRIIYSVRAALRFRGYRPQPLSWLSASRWSKQYGQDRALVERLLDSVIYLSEKTTREVLLNRNAALMARLKEAGLPAKNLIYVSIHEAGSSSPVMLNLLRDGAFLEKLGCRLIDGRDTLNLVKAMNELGEGALIYVDDFVGSGNQFCTERDFISQNFVGTFSEFMLAPSICEEAFEKLDERGIQAFTGHKHVKAERPLHPECEVFSEEDRLRLAALCRKINKFGLGYKGLATMVVLYRGAPTTVPVILRGNVNQKPYFGIFPRTIDLPLPSG